MWFWRSYPQTASVHLSILIKESRTGNNPKVTSSSEISVYGYFLLDTEILYETAFICIYLLLTSSKSKKKMVSSSLRFVTSLWFLDIIHNKIDLIQKMLVSYSIFPVGPTGWHLLEILSMQRIINFHSSWHFVWLFIFPCIYQRHDYLWQHSSS